MRNKQKYLSYVYLDVRTNLCKIFTRIFSDVAIEEFEEVEVPYLFIWSFLDKRKLDITILSFYTTLFDILYILCRLCWKLTSFVNFSFYLEKERDRCLMFSRYLLSLRWPIKLSLVSHSGSTKWRFQESQIRQIIGASVKLHHVKSWTFTRNMFPNDRNVISREREANHYGRKKRKRKKGKYLSIHAYYHHADSEPDLRSQSRIVSAETGANTPVD